MKRGKELTEEIEKDCRYCELCKEKFNNYLPCFRWRRQRENFDKTRCQNFKDWLLADEVWIGKGI